MGTVVTDLHNDSGVFAGDADREAYDLMVRGTYEIYLEKI